MSTVINSDSPEKNRVHWDMTPTQLLIASWLTRRPQFKFMPPREIYATISEDLQEVGYNYNDEQCAHKWYSLKQNYYRNKSTAMERCKPSTWMHYQAMADALGDPDPHPETAPICVSVRDSGAPPPETEDNDSADGFPSADAFPTKPPQTQISDSTNSNTPKVTVRSVQISKVSSHVPTHTGPPNPRKRNSDWLECFAEMKEEWQTRRQERLKMHEERMEVERRKLNLLEKLINTLNHK